jgi:hypothetical protein
MRLGDAQEVALYHACSTRAVAVALITKAALDSPHQIMEQVLLVTHDTEEVEIRHVPPTLSVSHGFPPSLSFQSGSSLQWSRLSTTLNSLLGSEIPGGTAGVQDQAH